MQSWILTFNRPVALNRQIAALKSWTDVHIFSNYPEVLLTEEHLELHKQGRLPILYNTLSDAEATAYTARSWNAIFLKAFKTENEVLCVQDDTHLTSPDTIQRLILENKERYDLIWAPAGDQFFFLKKDVVRKVGFFDERFATGAFCGDADYLKRVWQNYDQNKLSIVEKHDFGFVHNDIGLASYIPTDIHSKAVDANYLNQHQEIQKLDHRDLWMRHAQSWWQQKWGHPLNGVGDMRAFDSPPVIPEIWMYPWFCQKYLGIDGTPTWCQ